MKILLLLLIPILFLLLVFFTKKPGFIYDKTFGAILGQSISITSIPNQPDIPNIPNQPSLDSNNPLPLVDQSKNFLDNKSQQLTGNLKNSVFQLAQNSLNTVFDKPPNSSGVQIQIVDIPKSSTPKQSISTIDLSKDSNLKLSLSIGSTYYLQFQNVTSSQCLYIASNKYQIDANKMVEITLNSSGTYPIKINSCDLNDKVVGEFDVQ